MKDSLQNIIYVGKSKNLKSRVGSYFINSKSHSPKVVKMVRNLKDFKYIVTDTEFEAFMLECRLIKEIKPIYNRLMKSTSSYTYIKINGDYSNIEASSQLIKDDGAFYFGPYTSKNTVERCLQGIKECFKIMCSGNYKKSSPCLNYSLGTCIGFCFDPLAKEEYKNILVEIVKLFNASDRTILHKMELKMNDAVEKFDFENAAKYRDYISAVNSLVNREKVLEFNEENKNIVLIEYLEEARFKFFLIKGNRILFSEEYSTSVYAMENLKVILRNNILKYFSIEDLNNLIKIGRDEIDEVQIIYTYLKSHQNNCKYIAVSDEWIKAENYKHIEEALNILVSTK
ncbi:MAG: UvrB/UvrC motif-containing protein [Clostridiaceae bacterium]|nr:UvrB/UvrC motif-containing protein [Clostridiaceae bacterium]